MNILDIIMAFNLSFMSIFFDRRNGELCVFSIVNFSIFIGAILRNMHFFDILSDTTQLVTAIFLGRIVVRYLRIFR